METEKVARFVVARVFPATDQLGVDILRLMAAYNDVREVAEWMIQPSEEGGKFYQDKHRMKLGFLYRLFIGIMHEALGIVDSMQTTDCKRLIDTLPTDGKQALENLRRAGNDLRSQLAASRNNAIFHYNRDELTRALGAFIQMFSEKEKVESRIHFKGNRAWYVLPDSLREVIVYRFTTGDDVVRVPEMVGEFLSRAMRVQAYMNTFLEEMTVAYLKDRRIEDEMRSESA
jgi:hypothetical protein